MFKVICVVLSAVKRTQRLWLRITWMGAKLSRYGQKWRWLKTEDWFCLLWFFFFFSPPLIYLKLLFPALPIFFPFTFELSFILVFLAFSIWKYRICIQAMFLYSQKTSEEIGSISEKPPINPSATLPATVEDDPFGSRKARSSFGKGFFKIRGGKKTTSSPSLGECKRNDLRSWS